MSKILIVDDSRSARAFMKSCVAAENTEIFEASDGSEAVETFARINPDLVFMDLTMPVMDGFEAVARIRATDTATPIVVLTADIQKQTRDRVEAAGATAFLQKPPKKAQIAETVARYLGSDADADVGAGSSDNA